MTTYDDSSTAHEKAIVIARLVAAGEEGIPVKYLEGYAAIYKPNPKYATTRLRMNLHIRHGTIFLFKPHGSPNSNSQIIMLKKSSKNKSPTWYVSRDYTVYANGDVYSNDSSFQHGHPYQWWFADQPTPKYKRYLPMS